MAGRWRVAIAGAVLGAAIGGGLSALAPPVLTAQALVLLAPPKSGPPTPPHGAQLAKLTSNIVQLTAHGGTASQAERAANTAARDYIAAHPTARVLDVATTATAAPRAPHLATMAGLGALLGLLGLLAGAVVRWLYERVLAARRI